MSYPGNLKLPDGMTIENAGFMLALNLWNAVLEITDSGQPIEDAKSELLWLTSVVVQTFSELMDQNPGAVIIPKSSQFVADALEGVEDWMREEGERL